MKPFFAILFVSFASTAAPPGLFFHAIAPYTEWDPESAANVRYDCGSRRSTLVKIYPAVWSAAHVGVHHYHVDLGYWIAISGGGEAFVRYPYSRSNPDVTKGLILFQSYSLEQWQFVYEPQAGLACWPTGAQHYMGFGCYWPPAKR